MMSRAAAEEQSPAEGQHWDGEQYSVVFYLGLGCLLKQLMQQINTSEMLSGTCGEASASFGSQHKSDLAPAAQFHWRMLPNAMPMAQHPVLVLSCRTMGSKLSSVQSSALLFPMPLLENTLQCQEVTRLCTHLNPAIK